MSDIKLFQIQDSKAYEIHQRGFNVEKSLQNLIEKNLEKIFGVLLLESEYKLGTDPGGRIDTLGIDENNGPVIIEYKRSSNDNVINQGLFYLDYLLERKAEFQLLVQNRINQKLANSIEWDNSRLICIAQDFNRFDEHAIRQMRHNIELFKYRYYDEKQLLMLELANSIQSNNLGLNNSRREHTSRSIAQRLQNASEPMKRLYETIDNFILSLGEDIQRKELKNFIAYKRITNFVCLEFHPQNNTIVLFLKLDQRLFKIEENFSRDVSKIGHHGTGNFEIVIGDDNNLERSKRFIQAAYDEN